MDELNVPKMIDKYPFQCKVNSMLLIILGNHGAARWDYAIFLGESLLQELKSPWELILTKLVPEVVQFHPVDWAGDLTG